MITIMFDLAVNLLVCFSVFSKQLYLFVMIKVHCIYLSRPASGPGLTFLYWSTSTYLTSSCNKRASLWWPGGPGLLPVYLFIPSLHGVWFRTYDLKTIFGCHGNMSHLLLPTISSDSQVIEHFSSKLGSNLLSRLPVKSLTYKQTNKLNENQYPVPPPVMMEDVNSDRSSRSNQKKESAKTPREDAQLVLTHTTQTCASKWWSKIRIIDPTRLTSCWRFSSFLFRKFLLYLPMWVYKAEYRIRWKPNVQTFAQPPGWNAKIPQTP